VAQHFGQRGHDFLRVAVEHAGLRATIDKQIVDQSKARMTGEILEDDRVVGLSHESADSVELDRLTDVDMLRVVGVEKAAEIEHGIGTHWLVRWASAVFCKRSKAVL
jgi:hypothetical protein